MRIKHEFPPNYDELKQRFDIEGKPVVFTYGDTLYVPLGGEIPDHLMKHEETHQRQQDDMGVENWWRLYMQDDEFRLNQELEAYRNQYQYSKETDSRQVRRGLLQQIAEDLSSKIYGNLIDKQKAIKLIES